MCSSDLSHQGAPRMEVTVFSTRSGAKDFIVKPFKPDRVLKTVTSILGAP